MPSSYIGYAVNFGNEPNVEKVKAPCDHYEDPDEIIVREDGDEVCRNCDYALTGFETIFGDSIDEMDI